MCGRARGGAAGVAPRGPGVGGRRELVLLPPSALLGRYNFNRSQTRASCLRGISIPIPLPFVLSRKVHTPCRGSSLELHARTPPHESTIRRPYCVYRGSAAWGETPRARGLPARAVGGDFSFRSHARVRVPPPAKRVMARARGDRPIAAGLSTIEYHSAVENGPRLLCASQYAASQPRGTDRVLATSSTSSNRLRRRLGERIYKAASLGVCR